MSSELEGMFDIPVQLAAHSFSVDLSSSVRPRRSTDDESHSIRRNLTPGRFRLNRMDPAV